MKNAKFKVGQVLILKEENSLEKYGWNKNMMIKITKIQYVGHFLSASYNFIHLTDSAPYFPKNTLDGWSLDIIDNNFEENKTLTILYGDINDQKNDKK